MSQHRDVLPSEIPGLIMTLEQRFFFMPWREVIIMGFAGRESSIFMNPFRSFLPGRTELQWIRIRVIRLQRKLDLLTGRYSAVSDGIELRRVILRTILNEQAWP